MNHCEPVLKDLDLIYFAARELPPETRPAYLSKVCAGDGALRHRVEQMLAVAGEAEAFMDERLDDESEPVARIPARPPAIPSPPEPAPALPPDEAAGTMVGRYKILERVGEGGCGVVYVAEQTEPVRRRVALKVVKLGMDTKQVVARFEAERQALAMMDHPNIARVFDAGTTETGRPFFVMELVRGIKITDYCDQVELSTQERLDLFIKVCQAIQHAHQKGIIHRDIKPSNILVTLHDGVPVPKVIDFGIAKATEGRLTDATVYTQLHQFIGTPAYMSPEQAEMSGLDIDTRSDIYSLGVLLYELLAGSTPFDAEDLLASGLDAMRRTIREREPLRPSTKLRQTLGAVAVGARKVGAPATDASPSGITCAAGSRRLVRIKETITLLRGDLDWIVMKCLEKDRSRRYETANGLAADLKRHLNHEPVTARPPSAAYRFQKAFRRNKVTFAAAAAVGLTLLVGTGVSTWQAVEATRARRAEVKQRIAAQGAQGQAALLQKKAEIERQRAEEQLTRAEWLVYASKLMLAQTDFEAGDGGWALRYLEECQPSLRGWEHRYLRTRVNSQLTLTGHRSDLSSVAFSPDGDRIVTGSKDKTAKVWDAATGRELFALKGHHGEVLCVAFSADGRRIVTSGGEWSTKPKPGELKVWDAVTGQLLLNLPGHSYTVWSAAFSPDGRRLVAGAGDRGYGPGEMKIWDIESGQEILTLRDFVENVRCVAFSPDGLRVASGSTARTAKVWDAATGQELLTLKGHARELSSIVFSPSGHRIVTGSEDATLKIWDARTGRELRTLKGHRQRVTSCAFSPNGRRIVSGSAEQSVKIWDLETGQEILTLKGHSAEVRGVAFSPDDQRILSASSDRTAKLWDAIKGQEVQTLRGHIDTVNSLAFSPDSRRIVTGSADQTAKVWDLVTGQAVISLRGHTGKVCGVAFSPDGRRIATGSEDKMVKVWDAKTGREVLSLLGHTDGVRGVAFSPDGQRIVTGAGDWGATDPGKAKVWHADAGRELLTVTHPRVISTVAFSPDGKRFATGSADRTAKVWETETGRELLVLKGHAGALFSVAFSPDGRRLLTAGSDQTARVWDATTGRELLILKGHVGVVRSVAHSPDGERIVTAGDDRIARVWEAGTGQEVLALKEHASSVWSVAFSPDGHRIVTGITGAKATAKVWSAISDPSPQ